MKPNQAMSAGDITEETQLIEEASQAESTPSTSARREAHPMKPPPNKVELVEKTPKSRKRPAKDVEDPLKKAIVASIRPNDESTLLGKLSCYDGMSIFRR